jgi:hypothetical protein
MQELTALRLDKMEVRDDRRRSAELAGAALAG